MDPATQALKELVGRPMTRRKLLLSIPALAIAQQGRPAIALRTLNHVTLSVSDPKRSLEFYQGLFGMPVEGRQGADTISLQIGSGAHLGLSRKEPNAQAGIHHFCMTTDN